MRNDNSKLLLLIITANGPRGLIGNRRRSRKIHVATHFLHHHAILITLTNALSCSVTSFPAPAGSVWWHQPTPDLSDSFGSGFYGRNGGHARGLWETQHAGIGCTGEHREEDRRIQLLDLKRHGKSSLHFSCQCNFTDSKHKVYNTFQIHIISSCFLGIVVTG